jgi:hypothetical protein
MYDVFDLLINQFQIAVQQMNRTMIREELNDFFQGCFIHLAYSIPPIGNQYIANKILTRMTGVLPIRKENFELTNRDGIKFASLFLEDVKSHYDDILSTVTEHEWISFRDGLLFYLSVELLTQSKDTIDLIDQTKNIECKKDLANCLLKRLEELQRPVLGLNWTNLFTMVDPNILSIKQLELTRSIQTYITCLVFFFENDTSEMEIKKKIDRQFDELIRTEHLPGKIKMILLKEKFSFLFCFS